MTPTPLCRLHTPGRKRSRESSPGHFRDRRSWPWRDSIYFSTINYWNILELWTMNRFSHFCWIELLDVKVYSECMRMHRTIFKMLVIASIFIYFVDVQMALSRRNLLHRLPHVCLCQLPRNRFIQLLGEYIFDIWLCLSNVSIPQCIMKHYETHFQYFSITIYM